MNSDLQVGDKVFFKTNSRDEELEGVVVKANPRTYRVQFEIPNKDKTDTRTKTIVRKKAKHSIRKAD